MSIYLHISDNISHSFSLSLSLCIHTRVYIYIYIYIHICNACTYTNSNEVAHGQAIISNRFSFIFNLKGPSPS